MHPDNSVHSAIINGNTIGFFILTSPAILIPRAENAAADNVSVKG